MQHLTETLVLMSDMSLPDDFQMCASVSARRVLQSLLPCNTAGTVFFFPRRCLRVYHPSIHHLFSLSLSLSALAGLRQCQDIA